MPAEPRVARPIYCDGCTQEATPEHLRGRVERLEWASRFRPVHIGTLFLASAPPAELANYFYCPENQSQNPEVRAMQDDLLETCGMAPNGAGSRESSLRGFQEADYFLAECVECPIGQLAAGEFDALLGRLMPTLAKRIRFSYRPKAIVLISDGLSGIAEALQSSGGEPQPSWPVSTLLPAASAADLVGRSRFRAELTAVLRRAK